LQKNLETLEARGVRVVAISVDSPAVTREHARKQGYEMLFLCDEKLEVISRYDLIHEKGFKGADISRPAEFLVDTTGTIRWVNLTDDYRVRARAEDILEQIDALRGQP